MNTRLLSLSCLIALCGPGSLLACSDDGSELPPAAQATVSAETGGDVKTMGAAVTIPAGALESDVKVTIQPMSAKGLPDADTVASPVFDFGPDGTQFSEPVELELEFDTSKLKDGGKAMMAYLDGDSWVQLKDSLVSGNKVTASTTHFTPFAVIIIGGAGQIAGACDTKNFTACGGNLVGTWEFVAACASVSVDGLADLRGSCADAEVAFTVDLTGQVEFKSDMTYSTLQDLTVMSKLSFPKSCIGDVECADLDNEDEWTEVNGACEQTLTTSKMDEESGTYSTSNGKLTLAAEGADGAGVGEYCVKGDRATLSRTEEEITVAYQIERK